MATLPVNKYHFNFNPNTEYEAKRLRLERDNTEKKLGKRSLWTKNNTYRWYPSENNFESIADEELCSQMQEYLPSDKNTNVKNSAKLAQWKLVQLFNHDGQLRLDDIFCYTNQQFEFVYQHTGTEKKVLQLSWCCYFKAGLKTAGSSQKHDKENAKKRKAMSVKVDNEMFTGFLFHDAVPFKSKLCLVPSTKSDPVSICRKVLGDHRIPKRVGHEHCIIVSKDEYVPLISAMHDFSKKRNSL